MRLGYLLVAAALTAGLSACGAGSGDDGVASANGGKAQASASAQPTMDPKDARLKFAQCMRQHGVDMPDPGEEGRVEIRSGAKDKSKMDAAMKACQKYLEAAGKRFDPNDPKVRDALLKFAKCMRDNGVDMPDPGADGGFKIRANDKDKDKVEKAQKACEHLMPGRGPR